MPDPVESVFRAMKDIATMKNSLDCCVAVPQAEKACKKQEKKMFNEYDTYEMSETERQKNYLSNSLSSAYWTKDAELMEAFNLNGVTPPRSPKEFVEFIKDGKFEFVKNYLNDDGSWRDDVNHPYFYDNNITHYMNWINPDKVPDLEGYRAASKKMNEAKTKADRKIVVGEPAEGLAALEEFEAATFH
jgi:hypothetical protein